MKLQSCLKAKRSEILTRWHRVITDSYSSESVPFLNNPDPFANPVGTTLLKSMETLLDELLSGASPDRLAPVLDRILRIRAVQDFLPSQALAFLPALKDVVREVIGEEETDPVSEEVREFDALVDRLTLLAVDIYVKCRETIYEIRVREFKDRAYKLLERADLVCAAAPDSSGGL
ncbi:MAG: hypothetical protein GXP58_03495 [Deltaproteobacteria bacterium]|nr:hypothetical protein [Deltaproteobacteria bacterium]